MPSEPIDKRDNTDGSVSVWLMLLVSADKLKKLCVKLALMFIDSAKDVIV